MKTLITTTCTASMLFAGVMMLSSAAIAQDEGLYGVPVPDDAAFVRALGFDEAQVETPYGVTLPESGDYAVVLPGTVDSIAPKQVVTLTPFGAFTHDPQTDRDKVQITLINAGYPGEASLRTADGKVAIAAAATGTAAFREVNPLVIPVAIYDDSRMIGDPFTMTLVRDENPTVWVAVDGTADVIVSDIVWDK